MEIKTLKVYEDDWKKLMRYRIELRYKSIADVINKMLKMLSLQEMKEK